MDIGLGEDVYDSFKRYQSLLIEEFDKMAGEFSFHTVDANSEFEAIQERIRTIVSEFFSRRPEWDAAPRQPAQALS
jgi:dTMP kinase